MQFLESALRLSTPLIFAALGGVLSERVGVVNIALEGMLLAGAFAAMSAVNATGHPWLGILAAGGIGIIVALLHALLVLWLREDAIISGVGLHLLALGLTTFLLRAVYHGGVGVQVHGPTPWFSALAPVPLVRTLIGSTSPFVPLAMLTVAITWFVLYRTRMGIRLRAVGEAPKAALAAGVRVDNVRTAWLVAGGALAGIGGAYLSLEAAGRFTENLSAGRGFLALAAVICGRWHPLGAAAAVLFFGLSEAAQMQFQGRAFFGVQFPSEIFSALPYLLGLLALAVPLGRNAAPAGIGQFD